MRLSDPGLAGASLQPVESRPDSYIVQMYDFFFDLRKDFHVFFIRLLHFFIHLQLFLHPLLAFSQFPLFLWL